MPEFAAESFGVILRRHRLARGLTQEELAERSGLSARAIGNMERGQTRQPYRHSVRSLADALRLAGPQRSELDRASRLVARAPAMAGAGTPRPGAPLQAVARIRPLLVPRQLPAAVSQFAGRAAELDMLTSVLDEASGTSGHAAISAISGMAGVGKSALAVHWAHQMAGRFPDGQLYANLRGYDPVQPMPPADALARFLRALGVSGRDIPREADERAGRFRSLVADRQILVLLDNAGSVEQVRPLLPGTPGCAVLVTSRDALAGLVARDGARRLDLGPLPLADAVGLLRALTDVRVNADPQAAATLAAQCCRLPLALRVAAELAAARPAVSLASLAGELADQQRRLDLLDAGGDPRTSVRAVFSWSYRHLEPDTARVFLLAGLHPGSDLDLYAAAALTGTGRASVRQPRTPR